MGDRGVKVIEYIDGFSIDKDGHFFPVIKQERVVLSYSRRYFNSLYLLIGLTPCARNLIDWLQEEMNSDNIIHSSAFVRSKFRMFIFDMSNGDINYVDQTVKAAFMELSAKGCLIKKTKGTFRVNPKYFFKGNDQDRFDLVMHELKNRSSNENFKVLSYKKPTKKK